MATDPPGQCLLSCANGRDKIWKRNRSRRDRERRRAPHDRRRRQLHGGTLATIDDVYAYATTTGKNRELSNSWQAVRRLILDRAPRIEITHQIERALFMDGKLDLRRSV
jgi:hypothetical protein